MESSLQVVYEGTFLGSSPAERREGRRSEWAEGEGSNCLLGNLDGGSCQPHRELWRGKGLSELGLAAGGATGLYVSRVGQLLDVAWLTSGGCKQRPFDQQPFQHDFRPKGRPGWCRQQPFLRLLGPCYPVKYSTLSLTDWEHAEQWGEIQTVISLTHFMHTHRHTYIHILCYYTDVIYIICIYISVYSMYL